jgi:hypothetical protein
MALIRGLFWTVSYPVLWGDEAQHFSYIQSVATGHGIPITGKNLITADGTYLLKNDAADAYRSLPLDPSPSDARWGLGRQQYEGFQAPLYYLLMTPFYWMGRPFGLLGSVYALRVATLMLTLVAVPILYLIARELFPKRPAVWLLAPICLVQLQLFNSYGFIDNDAIMVVTGSLCLLALLRGRHGLTPQRAIFFGAAVGLAGVGKGTAVQLVPLLILGLVGLYLQTGRRTGQFFRWLLVAGTTATAIIAPWIAFNVHVYHAVSGAKPQAALVEPVLGKVPQTLAGAHQLWRLALVSSFVAQVNVPAALSGYYRHGWAIVGAFLVIAGALVAAAFRKWDEVAAQLWLCISLPLGLATLIVATMIESGTGSSVLGRHLGALLPAFCLAVAFGAVAVFGPRLGTAVLFTLLALASFLEIGSQQAFIRVQYTQARIGSAVPIIDQSYNDGIPTTATGIGVRAPCPATALSFAFAESGPPVTIGKQGIAPSGTSGVWTTYMLRRPQYGTFIVDLPARTRLYVDRGSPNRDLFLVGAPSGRPVPVARIYCNVHHADDARFTTLYTPQHPFPLTYRSLSDWPAVERAIAVMGAAIVIAALALDSLHRVRSTASSEDADENRTS